ncbi:MAG: hypothetical protein WBH77_08865 [Saccharofermentanales bacterium]
MKLIERPQLEEYLKEGGLAGSYLYKNEKDATAQRELSPFYIFVNDNSDMVVVPTLDLE